MVLFDLPKAVNGAELKSPANAPESVKYQIDVLEENQLVIYVQAGVTFIGPSVPAME